MTTMTMDHYPPTYKTFDMDAAGTVWALIGEKPAFSCDTT